MKTAHELMSMKKYTSSNIDESIEKKEHSIREKLNDTLTFINAEECKNIGEDFIFLGGLKDARLLMNSNSYKEYERTGKIVSYEDFLTEYHSSL